VPSPASRMVVPVLFLAALSASCGARWEILREPADALVLVDGQAVGPGGEARSAGRRTLIRASREGYKPFEAELRHRAPWGLERVEIKLEPELYAAKIAALAKGATLRIDGGQALALPMSGELAYGDHELSFAAPGLPEQSWRLELRGPVDIAYRLHRELLPAGLRPLGVWKCGPAPKQVVFSPDSRLLYVPLLSGGGFDILDWKAGTRARIEVPGAAADQGFVEGIFPEGTSSFWVSQMTRNAIHEFSIGPGRDPAYLRTVPSRGTWTKVIAYEPRASILALSNWVSNDVTILDYSTGQLKKSLSGLATPRGLAFGPDGKSLYVASFGDGRITRFDTASWKSVATARRPGGAGRHLVVSRDGARLWASDMSLNQAVEYSAADLSVLRVMETGPNPNTIDLDPSELILAVSCRGPNNPASYILRSPEPGEVRLFDARDGSLLGRVVGGAQPTGLDISPDGKLLAFSNFQDANVELYDISGLVARLAP
jgi:DNA-binding beta-propeller fold protein YncE